MLSHLDYSNSLLSGLPDSSIKIQQKVQKQCSKISTRKKCKTQFNRKHKATTLATNKTNASTIKFSHWSINVSTKKHLNTYKISLMKKWQEDRDYNLKNAHNWKYHTQKTRPLPVEVSVYTHQPNRTSYPKPLGMNTILKNSKNCSKLISSTKFITNKSHVKCLS